MDDRTAAIQHAICATLEEDGVPFATANDRAAQLASVFAMREEGDEPITHMVAQCLRCDRPGLSTDSLDIAWHVAKVCRALDKINVK